MTRLSLHCLQELVFNNDLGLRTLLCHSNKYLFQARLTDRIVANIQLLFNTLNAFQQLSKCQIMHRNFVAEQRRVIVDQFSVSSELRNEFRNLVDMLHVSLELQSVTVAELRFQMLRTSDALESSLY